MKKSLLLAFLALATAFAHASGTGLPVIHINTYGQTIHHSSTGVWTTMTFSLSDPNNPENNIGPLTNQQIRGRGNWTWMQPKQPFRIRFRNNQQQSPFGLPQARNWVLLANHADESLIRTSFAFELGYRLGLKCTPTFHHVDLYLNGSFEGSYLFTEHRQADPDGRENVPGRPFVDGQNGGWLVELDWRFDTSSAGGDPGFRTTDFDLPILIKSPDFAEFPNNGMIPPGVDNFVRNDWEKLTRLVASESFPENDYRDLIDMDSWIKHMLVRTVTNEQDFSIREFPLSVFFHRQNSNSPIRMGPLWDFDISFGGWYYRLPFDSHLYPSHVFWARFLQDPVFRVRWKEIWNANSTWIRNDMYHFIDSMEIKLRESARLNNLHWGHNARYPLDENSTPNAINAMKMYFVERFALLNELYNQVNVLPANDNFTSVNSPQTFTLVAYGEMMDLNATLQNATLSAFEIVSTLTQTPTGNGGYLATISITPKDGFEEKTHRDTLILSGTNQGNSFLHRIPLSFTNNATNVVETHNYASLQVFPNPVTNILHVVHDWQSGDVVELFDMNGRRVFSQPVFVETGYAPSLQDDTFIIDMSQFPTGNYILRTGHRMAKIVKR